MVDAVLKTRCSQLAVKVLHRFTLMETTSAVGLYKKERSPKFYINQIVVHCRSHWQCMAQSWCYIVHQTSPLLSQALHHGWPWMTLNYEFQGQHRSNVKRIWTRSICFPIRSPYKLWRYLLLFSRCSTFSFAWKTLFRPQILGFWGRKTPKSWDTKF